MTPFEEADARLAAMFGYEPAVKFLACGVCHTGMRTLGELCAIHVAEVMRDVIVVSNDG